MRLFANSPLPQSHQRFDLNIMRNPSVCNFRFPMGANFRTDISRNMREARYYANSARNQSDFSAFEKLIGFNNQFDTSKAASCLSSINVNCRSANSHKSLLHVAAERGNIAATAFLISAGVCIDAADHEKNTPLMEAVKNQHIDEVKLLVGSGANVFARNGGSENSMDLANNSGNSKCFEYLNTQKAYLPQQFTYYRKQLHNGSIMDFFEKKIGTKTYQANLQKLQTMLADKNLDLKKFNHLVDTVDINKSHYLHGNTLLHEAAKRGNVNAINCLLDRGAEIEACNEGRQTPLVSAVMCGQDMTALHLFQKGANVFTRDINNDGVMQLSPDRSSLFYQFMRTEIGESIF